MPSDRKRVLTEEHRSRIRTSQLLNRLQNFLLGKNDRRTKKPIDLSPHQVAGILGLLKKAIPDLQSIEHVGDVGVKHTFVSDKPLTPDEWADEFCEPDASRPN